MESSKDNSLNSPSKSPSRELPLKKKKIFRESDHALRDEIKEVKEETPKSGELDDLLSAVEIHQKQQDLEDRIRRREKLIRNVLLYIYIFRILSLETYLFLPILML